MRKNVLILALCSLAVLSAGCSRSGGENVLSLRHNEVDSLDLSQALSVTQIVPLDNQVPVDKIIQVKRLKAHILSELRRVRKGDASADEKSP